MTKTPIEQLAEIAKRQEDERTWKAELLGRDAIYLENLTSRVISVLEICGESITAQSNVQVSPKGGLIVNKGDSKNPLQTINVTWTDHGEKRTWVHYVNAGSGDKSNKIVATTALNEELESAQA